MGASNRQNGYFEGNGYIVTWAVGHLVGLCEPESYGYVPMTEIYKTAESKQKAYNELPLIPEKFKFTVLDKTKQQFEIVKTLMNRDDVDSVIDCGDFGPEGHILQWFIRIKAKCQKPIKRFCATSLTDEAIKEAFRNLQPIEKFEKIIIGELCKKKADWIMGMSLSRAASIRYSSGINIGRVMSPTLYFIFKRFMDVKDFKVTNYFGIMADFVEGFKAFWNKDAETENIFPPNIKDSEGRVLDYEAVKEKIKDIKPNDKAVVSNIVIAKKATDRPQLYDITELQREANRRFGYTASDTLSAAQSLYETYKVLSYPRTDSRYITSDLVPYMPERVKDISSLSFNNAVYNSVCQSLLTEGLNIDKRIVNDKEVTDHHALIVTEKIKGFNIEALTSGPNEPKDGVTGEMLKNILCLVIERMLVAFSKPYIYEKTDVEITLTNGIKLTSSGSRPLSLGFKAVEEALKNKQQSADMPSGDKKTGAAKKGAADNNDSETDTGETEEAAQTFPALTKGQSVTIKDISVTEKKTSPPKLHTEATLLTAMENAGAQIENGKILKGKGIGTQATRAEIIKKLFDIGYCESQKQGKTNYIIPTVKGISVIGVLPKELISAAVTADWEQKIFNITQGKYTQDEFMNEFAAFIRTKTDEIKQAENNITFYKQKESHGVCPWCKSDIYEYIKKNDKNKPEYFSFYCSQKCGFSVYSNDKSFINLTGKPITEAELKRLVTKGKITLDCQSKNKGTTYKGEFTIIKKVLQETGKTYCNIEFKPVPDSGKKQTAKQTKPSSR